MCCGSPDTGSAAWVGVSVLLGGALRQWCHPPWSHSLLRGLSHHQRLLAVAWETQCLRGKTLMMVCVWMCMWWWAEQQLGLRQQQ